MALARGVIGGVGAKIELPEGALDFILFGEGAPVFVLSYSKEQHSSVQAIAQKYQVPFTALGETGGDTLSISGLGRVLGNFPVAQLKARFEGGFEAAIR